MKAVGLRLPEFVSWSKALKVVRREFGIPFPNRETTHTLPTMNKPPQLSWLGQPKQRMHVIRHQDEADALSLQLFELVIENSQDNPFGMVQIEQPTTTKDGKGQKEHVSLIVELTPLVAHAPSIKNRP
jgi:hypothetical protein